MKKILPIFLAFVFLATASKSAFAADLELEKIGTTDVSGQTFTSWTYYGLNPSFSGTADPAESIIISIDGEETATTSGTDGAWTVSPTGLSSYGIYEVDVSTEMDNILFSLTLASSSATTKGGNSTSTDSAATSLPTSGFSDLFIFAGLGTLFIAAAAASKYVFSWYE